MAKYEGKPATVNRPAADIYALFNDFRNFEARLEALPQEQRAQLGQLQFEQDAIVIETPQVGTIRFEVLERQEPNRIVFGSPASPVPLQMEVTFTPVAADSTEVKTVIDLEIPAMLRPFVGPKMQAAADQFGQMMSNLSK